MNWKIIDNTHIKFGYFIYHIAQLKQETIDTLKSEGCQFSESGKYFLMDNEKVGTV